MRKLAALLVLVLTLLAPSCALLSTVGVGSPVATFTLADFAAARDNFTAAGLPVEAKCMQNAIDKLQPTAPGTYSVKGLVSLGSLAYIDADAVQKRVAAGPDALSPECQQVVGKVTIFLAKESIKGATKFIPLP